MKLLRKLENYLSAKEESKYKSELNGELEVSVSNGVKMLHSATANYSYGGLHQVFRKAISSARISEKKPETVLILGFAAGSIASILQEELRINCSITGVEHDPVILEIFNSEFKPGRFEKLELINKDAFEFMRSNTASYELICVDLFFEKQVPEACFDYNFLDQLRKSLSHKGSLLFNFIIENEEQQSGYDKVYSYFKSAKGKVKEKHVAPSNMVLIWEK